jgi:hypothetical protein
MRALLSAATNSLTDLRPLVSSEITAMQNVRICRIAGPDRRPGRVYFLTLLEPLAGHPDSGPYRQVGQSSQP